MKFFKKEKGYSYNCSVYFTSQLRRMLAWASVICFVVVLVPGAEIWKAHHTSTTTSIDPFLWWIGALTASGCLLAFIQDRMNACWVATHTSLEDSRTEQESKSVQICSNAETLNRNGKTMCIVMSGKSGDIDASSTRKLELSLSQLGVDMLKLWEWSKDEPRKNVVDSILDNRLWNVFECFPTNMKHLLLVLPINADSWELQMCMVTRSKECILLHETVLTRVDEQPTISIWRITNPDFIRRMTGDDSLLNFESFAKYLLLNVSTHKLVKGTKVTDDITVRPFGSSQQG